MDHWRDLIAGTGMEKLAAAAELPYRAWSEQFPGGRPFAYFCSYWPEELTMAFGWEPVRIFPPAKAGTPARLPTYCCSVARGCLEQGERGDLPFRETGFVHTCDTMQCLSQIWRYAVTDVTVSFVPPVTLNAPGALRYCAAELERIGRQLERLSGRAFHPDDLRRAIALNNRVRGLVQRLEELRPHLPAALVARLERTAQVVPRSLYAKALEEILPVLPKRAGEEAENRRGKNRLRRVLISGAVLENEEIPGLLAELGVGVAADDTCTGYRHFAGLVEETGDLFEALAARILQRPPCPCRHQGLAARRDYLLELARSRGAEAVILILRKYCDPHAWDAVSLAQGLRAAGLPVYVLELEGASPGGQEKTRLQAFLECL
ncbi:MAG: 2-hydroxyacyl-CoA dehydratase family protein [Bacillota bacterium]